MKTEHNYTVDMKDISFSWSSGEKLLEIKRLQVRHGEKLFIYGPSGAGKSTLLSLLGGMVSPQQGEIEILGQSLNALSASTRDSFRADHLGFVFQQFNLIPYLDPVENVTLGLRFSKRRQQRLGDEPPRAAARRLLTALELDPQRFANLPARKLSIGQQQRVAAARALIGAPELIVADEPTSSLDADSQGRFLELLFDQCRSQESSLVFVSHDLRLAERFDRTLSLAEINSVSLDSAQASPLC